MGRGTEIAIHFISGISNLLRIATKKKVLKSNGLQTDALRKLVYMCVIGMRWHGGGVINQMTNTSGLRLGE